MKVIEFDLKFTHRWEEIKATCQKMNVAEVPQIRVSYTNAKARDESLFIFYEINEKNPPFFWQQLEGEKESIAKSIAAALGRSLNAKKPL